MPSEIAAPTRQRPEDILATTLSGPSSPGNGDGGDGWSPQGRRLFFLALTVAGIVLVVAGLLVTAGLTSTGRPTPLETGPGRGLPGQLLAPVENNNPPTTPPASVLVPPITDSLPGGINGSRPAQTRGVGSSPGSTAGTSSNGHPTPTTTPPSPTTTIPCNPLSQGLQQAQLPLPCKAPAVLGTTKATL